MARFRAEFQRCTDSNKGAVHLFFLLLMARFYKPIFAATDAAQRSPSIAEETMPPA